MSEFCSHQLYNSAEYLSNIFNRIGKHWIQSILQIRNWGTARLNDKYKATLITSRRNRAQSQEVLRPSSVDFPLTIYFHKTYKNKKVWAPLRASNCVVMWNFSLSIESWWLNGMKTILGIKSPRDLDSCH